MSGPDERRYAIDLLLRAGLTCDAVEIAAVAAIIPLVEGDVMASVDRPIGGSGFVAQTVILDRIAAGRHRPAHPSQAPVSSMPGLPAAVRASRPAAAPSGD